MVANSGFVIETMIRTRPMASRTVEAGLTRDTDFWRFKNNREQGSLLQQEFTVFTRSGSGDKLHSLCLAVWGTGIWQRENQVTSGPGIRTFNQTQQDTHTR
jgi:hypothetical protein